MADSTNVEIPGFSIPEKAVHKNLEEYIKNAQGRLIIATFSSLLERLLKMIEFAESITRKSSSKAVACKQNIEVCKHSGLLKAKTETIISTDDMDNYPPDRIIILATGAQGDEFAALMRIVQQDSRQDQASPRATPSSCLLRSSRQRARRPEAQGQPLTPGGEDHPLPHRRSPLDRPRLSRRDDVDPPARSRPKFFMPVHGYHYMLRVHADVAKKPMGSKEDVVIPDNSSVIEIQSGGARIVKLNEKAPSGLVLVDGFSVGDVQDVVIRDRQMLAQDGIFIVFGIVNAATGKLKKSPDIISRGFVYLRESQELLHGVRLMIKDTVERATRGQNPINMDFVKDNITDAVSQILTARDSQKADGHTGDSYDLI